MRNLEKILGLIKMLNTTLKKKMSDREYENQYSSCIELKKNNNELFEAKY